MSTVADPVDELAAAGRVRPLCRVRAYWRPGVVPAREWTATPPEARPVPAGGAVIAAWEPPDPETIIEVDRTTAEATRAMATLPARFAPGALRWPERLPLLIDHCVPARGWFLHRRDGAEIVWSGYADGAEFAELRARLRMSPGWLLDSARIVGQGGDRFVEILRASVFEFSACSGPLLEETHLLTWPPRSVPASEWAAWPEGSRALFDGGS